MHIFEYDDFRKYLIFRVKAATKRGKGQVKELAKALSVTPSLVSQIMNGTRGPGGDHAYGIAIFLGLNSQETEYFITLTELNRAQCPGLKMHLRKRLILIAGHSSPSEVASEDQSMLSPSDASAFYSFWVYSAIRLFTSIPPFQTLDTISSRFELPKEFVMEIVDFLVSAGLCREHLGKITIGPRTTWVENSSPAVSRHHLNWRLKGMDRLPMKTGQELYATIPMSLSEKDVQLIKDRLMEVILEINQIVDQSPSVRLMCLNIDWFKF